MFNLYDWYMMKDFWSLEYKPKTRSLTPNQIRVRKIKRKIKQYQMLKTKRKRR